ncbi:MAG: hypothetical protein GC150_17465 [Rhizobiales bacterium]|nr:hypothetical protein [Hyphomicrobiales bacterium]
MKLTRVIASAAASVAEWEVGGSGRMENRGCCQPLPNDCRHGVRMKKCRLARGHMSAQRMAGENVRTANGAAAIGFGDLRLPQVNSRWRIEDPAAPFDLFKDGTVRGGALLRPQPDANKAAIRAAVARRVIANHGASGPWDVPLPSVVISGKAY